MIEKSNPGAKPTEEKVQSSDEEKTKKKEKPRSLFDEHARIRLEKQRKELLADQIRYLHNCDYLEM